ncbi:hypothetical protein DUNSADRAFT_7483 [Dunaliella salina]|uniref:Uncharacterized protein n=1 Tax=Dunaliella salina TaxID=3046 RepID=A0ABQ7GLB4_DUNSA|nr:hypothetical protein DUNSADRAFT_7483 [Dunaliella salina]|eukprot:KAF5835398.1 hypothetical protein DUNSADRAFT_7483 [Dunaliella salina]
MLLPAGAVAVAVVPVCSGTSSAATQPQLYADLPRLPFPLELLALCMLRTITRRGHAGNLDAQAPNPLTVMASFATFFKHNTHKELLKYLRTQYHIVAELPIMEAADTDPQRQVPVEVLQHVAAGVELALRQRLGSELSPEQQEWERKARSLLQQPEVEQRLLSLQRPLQACCSDLQGIINAALQRAQQPSSAEGQVAQGSDARWVAVTGFEPSGLLEAARQVLPPEMCSQLKDELHVTLWHAEDPALGSDQELQECLLAAVGSEVTFEVTHVDFVPQGIAAAKVQLTSAPETVLAKLSGRYLHITLVIGPSGQAKDAKLLDLAVTQQSGGAQRCALPEPLPLVGQVLLVQE